MVKWSEKDATELFRRTGRSTFADKPCRTCGVAFTPASTASKDCDKCKKPDPKTYDCLVPKVKKKRGQRGKQKVGSGDDAPIDDGRGTLTKCSTCNGTYDPTLYGRKVPSNEKQWTEIIKGVGYDKYRCFCGHTWHRYT